MNKNLKLNLTTLALILFSLPSFAWVVSESSEGTLSSLDSVIGSDERKQITETTVYPYRTIGRVAVGCSGTLVGPRHVLTAGHCVYDTSKDSWYNKLEFSPAQSGSKQPFGELGFKKALATTTYTKDHKKEADFAIVVLNETIGNKLGWLSIGYPEDVDDVSITIAGYPGDKPRGTMWQAACEIAVPMLQMFGYECDTYGGMSGSSIEIENAKKRIVVGVHTLGMGTQNRGVRITKEVFNQIQTWIDANP